MGINESNRVENFNRHFKKTIKNASISIHELIIRFCQFEHFYGKSDNVTVEENNKFQEIKKNTLEIPLIQFFTEKYTDYARNKFVNNYWQAQFLFCKQKTKNAKIFEIQYKEKDNEQSYKVNANENFLKCSCYYNLQFGVPCKHILPVKIFLQQDNLENLYIYQRWRKDKNELTNNSSENYISFLNDKLKDAKIKEFSSNINKLIGNKIYFEIWKNAENGPESKLEIVPEIPIKDPEIKENNKGRPNLKKRE